MEKRLAINIDKDEVFYFDEIDRKIMEGLRDGKNSIEIGKEIFKSNRLVEGRRFKMIQRSGTKNSISLIVFSIRNKIIDL